MRTRKSASIILPETIAEKIKSDCGAKEWAREWIRGNGHWLAENIWRVVWEDGKETDRWLYCRLLQAVPD